MSLVMSLVMNSAFAQQSEQGSGNSSGNSSRSGNADDEDKMSVVRRSIFLVDESQRIASERFGSFMSNVDGFFSNAGSDDDSVSNGSWARIRFDATRDNAKNLEFKPSLKVRAVLPRTERKFKLLFSTEDDDGDDADRTIGQSALANSSNQNSSLALRFIQGARDKGDINLDLGIRQRSSEIQIFLRLKSTYRTTFSGNWTFNIANNYFYYSKDGYEDRLSLDFSRPFSNRDDLYFRTFFGFNWRKGQKAAVVTHTSGLYWSFGPTRSLAFEVLAAYHTALSGVDDRFRGHEIRFRWRHNIWRPWFFYEFWPSVAWPADNGYRRTEGFLLRAEMIIGQRY